MEANFEDRINGRLKYMLYPWKEKGQFMHIYLKCQQLQGLSKGDEYCVRMSSVEHPVGVPDPVGSSFYKLLQTEWTTEATHAFTTPLKMFKFYEYEKMQKLKFTIFVLSANKSVEEYCSAEELFQKVCFQEPTPVALKSEDGKNLGELSCSMITLKKCDDEENNISFDMAIELSSKDAKYINRSKLKIYGQGNYRDEFIEIYSSDWVVQNPTNSDDLSQNEQSEKVATYLLFPVYQKTILLMKQQEPIKNLLKYQEEKPEILDLKKLQKSCFSISSATYLVSGVKIQEKLDLIQFLLAGLNLNLIIGIDYTKSNEKNGSGHSLHTFSEIDKNHYVKPLDVVGGDILMQFCKNPHVTMYGFGGISTAMQTLSSHMKTSHRFPLTGSEQFAGVNSQKGMLATYLNSIDNNKVILQGPSCLKTLIKHTRDKATKGKDLSHKNYFILMIITDGIIKDMKKTIEEIKLCVDLPMSIVIVGVGEEELFENMRSLNNIKGIERDIVTIVQIDHYDEQHEEQFQAKVLEKLPGQITQYYETTMNIKPNEMEDHIKESLDQELTERKPKNRFEDTVLKQYLKKIDTYQNEKQKRIKANKINHFHNA